MAKKRIRPSWDAKPPPKGTKGYIRVVERGCGGYQMNTPDMVEYDCRHYDWTCDDCPVLLEDMERKQDELIAAVYTQQGPPRKRTSDFEFWMRTASVDTELREEYNDEEIKAALERQSVVESSLRPLSTGDLTEEESGSGLLGRQRQGSNAKLTGGREED